MTFTVSEMIMFVLFTAAITWILCCWLFRRRDYDGKFDGVFLINKNDPKMDPFKLMLTTSPTDMKQGDVLHIAVDEHVVSEILEGHKEEKR